MSLPFSDAQREAIRARLFESACRHAIDTGLKKTSLDMLTADAGISKSSFYKFYESKEVLFLQVAQHWEAELLAHAAEQLGASSQSPRERAASMVLAMFSRIHEMGIARFLQEDLPLLRELMQSRHALSSSQTLFDALKRSRITFTQPDETVLASIELLYLSIANIGEIGSAYFPALREVVCGACDRLVADA